jgi:hypothetical protein
MPHCFYIYNISSNDSAAIQTARAKIYLFITGTLYKIDSRMLVFAPLGQGFFHSNLPARSHSVELAPDCRIITRPPSGICEHLYRPARGTQELASNCYTKLAPTSLPYTYKHGTPFPSYILYDRYRPL